MSAADIANQYQAAFTTLQPQNSCYWKPLFYWLLDIALVNSYLLARATSRAIREKSRHHHDHQWFQNALVKILIAYSETLTEHIQIYRSTRTYCAHCQQNQLNWQSKHQSQSWSFETDITNIRGQFQGSCTQWRSDQCAVSLYKKENCWCL